MKMKEAEAEVARIGLQQKPLMEELRRRHSQVKSDGMEYKQKENATTSPKVEEKQKTSVKLVSPPRRSKSEPRKSYGLNHGSSSSSSATFQEPDLTLESVSLKQIEYMISLGLCTHEAFEEMKKRRAKRTRRSTEHTSFITEILQ
ncbi:hypothetical protein HHI36_002415 [Cryptolaemus montrouzieri]|uniref:Uncharacterized protein n=1 Tax=Cryptolaemus montrouzieri TaxID=559131 RepID=A0ABD2PAD0_9CUCU